MEAMNRMKPKFYGIQLSAVEGEGSHIYYGIPDTKEESWQKLHLVSERSNG